MNFTQSQLENYTLEELERFHRLYPDDLTVCQTYIRKMEAANEEADDSEDDSKRVEVIEEQLYFAQTLVEELTIAVGDANRLSDFRKQFHVLVSDSGFEL